MKTKKLSSKVTALLIGFTLLFVSLGSENLVRSEETEKNILSFESLGNSMTLQKVPVGSSESDINLPKTLNATVKSATIIDKIIPKKVDEEVPESVVERKQEEIPVEVGAPSEGTSETEQSKPAEDEAVDSVEDSTAEETTSEQTPEEVTTSEEEQTPTESEEATSEEPVIEDSNELTRNGETLSNNEDETVSESTEATENTESSESNETSTTDGGSVVNDFSGGSESNTESSSESDTNSTTQSESSESTSEESNDSSESESEPTTTGGLFSHFKAFAAENNTQPIDVTWVIDEELSDDKVFSSEEAGATFVYKPLISKKYNVKADLPHIVVKIITNNAFEVSDVVNGVKITVKADEGVFPEGSTLEVIPILDENKENLDELTEGYKDENANVAISYSFDIRVLNKNGVEIQPDNSRGEVYVSFELVDNTTPNLDANVYHIDKAMDIEELETSVDNDVITVQTTGFSYYTVEFTYNDLEYVMMGDSEVDLSVITQSLGLGGNITEAKSLNEELFYTFVKDDKFYIKSLKPFTTEEELEVTVNGMKYTIKVTDDPAAPEITDSDSTVTLNETGTYYINNDVTVASLNVTENCTINLNGHTLTISDGLSVADSKTLTIKDGDLIVNKTTDGISVNLNTSGTVTLDNAKVTVNGYENSNVLSATGTINLGNGILELNKNGSGNYGDATISGAGLLVKNGNAEISADTTLSKEFTLAADKTLDLNSHNLTVNAEFTNNGTITVGTGTLTAGTGALKNYGDINISTGSLVINTASTNYKTDDKTGKITFSDAGHLTLNADLINDGIITKGDTATITGTVKVKVTYDSKGGTDLEPVYKNANSLMEPPTSPTKAGSSFDKWYADNGCTKPWEFENDKLDYNATTIYAGWKAVKVTITLNKQGGESGSGSTTVNYGSAFETITPPVKEGYDFKGYYASTEYADGEMYIDADGHSAKNCDFVEAKTLYAKWVGKTNTINFVANGGTGSMDSVTTATGDYILPACTFTAPEGKEFDKWQIKGTNYVVGSTVKITDDTDIKAIWTDKKFTVSFDANGGTGTMAAVKAVGTYSLPDYEFKEPEGKVFDKWQIGEKTYSVGENITVTANVTVKATWKDKPAETYTVKFDANGGSGTMADKTGVSGEYTLPSCSFTAPSNKTFDKWSVGDKTYAAGDKITVTANTTVKATWKDSSSSSTTTYTVKFDANGGSGSMKNVTGVSGSYKLPSCSFSAPSKKRFYRWEVGSTKYKVGDTINVTSDITITAIWESDSDSDSKSSSNNSTYNRTTTTSTNKLGGVEINTTALKNANANTKVVANSISALSGVTSTASLIDKISNPADRNNLIQSAINLGVIKENFVGIENGSTPVQIVEAVVNPQELVNILTGNASANLQATFTASKEGSVPSEAKTTIQEKTPNGMKLYYGNMDFTKIVGTTSTEITEFGSNVKFTIAIPKDIQKSGNSYSFILSHLSNGKYTATALPDGDSNDSTYTITTNKLCPVAFAYGVAAGGNNAQGATNGSSGGSGGSGTSDGGSSDEASPKTLDYTGVWLVVDISLVLAAILGLIVYLRKR